MTTIRAHPDVRHAESADRVALVATLTSAFARDPVFEWWMPDPVRRAQLLPPFFDIALESYLPLGEVYTVGAATAVWLPVGAGIGEDTAARCLRAAEETADRLSACLALMEAAHPAEPHAYLWLLATHPDQQGQGLGSALVQHMLARCDHQGTPAYLEATSERNRKLYRRHGFVDGGPIQLPDGPPMFPMWREPHTRQPGTLPR